MNIEQLKGNWKQLKGGFKAEFAQLTDDDWAKVEGNAEKLVGIVQEKYGIAKDEAERKIDSMMNN